MESKQLFVVLAFVAVILPTVTKAREYVVGDATGWTIKFDYQDWAKDKQFWVGDTLVFNYTMGAHNVFRVTGAAFKDCVAPPVNEALTTGNDVITLATPGNKWYICGVGEHCKVGGQKLAITVLAASPTPAPIPASTGSADGIVTFSYGALMAAMVAIVMMNIV